MRFLLAVGLCDHAHLILGAGNPPPNDLLEASSSGLFFSMLKVSQLFLCSLCSTSSNLPGTDLALWAVTIIVQLTSHHIFHPTILLVYKCHKSPNGHFACCSSIPSTILPCTATQSGGRRRNNLTPSSRNWCPVSYLPHDWSEDSRLKSPIAWHSPGQRDWLMDICSNLDQQAKSQDFLRAPRNKDCLSSERATGSQFSLPSCRKCGVQI